jgi:hypothetical protein
VAITPLASKKEIMRLEAGGTQMKIRVDIIGKLINSDVDGLQYSASFAGDSWQAEAMAEVYDSWPGQMSSAPR